MKKPVDVGELVNFFVRLFDGLIPSKERREANRVFRETKADARRCKRTGQSPIVYVGNTYANMDSEWRAARITAIQAILDSSSK